MDVCRRYCAVRSVLASLALVSSGSVRSRAYALHAIVLLAFACVVSFSFPLAVSEASNSSEGMPGTASTPPGAMTTLRATAWNAISSASAFGRIPLSFELNQGQTHESVRFLTRSAGHAVFFTRNETVLVLRKPMDASTSFERTANQHGRRTLDFRRGIDAAAGASAAQPVDVVPSSAVLQMKLTGAQPAPRVEGLEPSPTKSHYLIGNDPRKWITKVPHYTKVKFSDVYPGIDQVFYGKDGALEYDLIVRPGADPARINIAFDGVGSVKLNAEGDVILETALGPITHRRPFIYQDVGSERRVIEGRYVMRGPRDIGIEVKNYIRSRPLVIDPAIVYSTYLGGSGSQMGTSIAVDKNGSAYVTGSVGSLDFPTVNPLPGGESRASAQDGFVAKLAPDGQTLVYATYLGGDFTDQPYSIAVDAQGNAHVAGFTSSGNFPTVNALRTSPAYGFVAKLGPGGDSLVYSTYLGGQDSEDYQTIAVDAQGYAYVAGQTTSADFPVQNAYQGTIPSQSAGFVTKLDPAGGLAYSTYLGGTGGAVCCGQAVRGIAVDSAGSAYVTGTTNSPDFPTLNPIPGFNCPGIFVTKLDPSGGSLQYSTCFPTGSSDSTTSQGIAVDVQGSAYITGFTQLTEFPTLNAYQSTNSGDTGYQNAFITKLSPQGNALVYSTYLGGSGTTFDAGQAIAVDKDANAYVTGVSTSSDFPIVDPLPVSNKGPYDTAFVTKFDAAGSTVSYSTFLGGTDGPQYGQGIAVDAEGNAYVTGFTRSRDFPVSENPIKGSNPSWSNQAFVTKIGSGASTATPTVTALATSATSIEFGQAVTFTATVSGNAPTGSVTFYSDGNLLGSADLAAATASLTVSSLAPGMHAITANYGGDGSNVPSVSMPLSVTVLIAPSVSMTSPADGAYFIAPATIIVTANASVDGGSLSRVEFYQGATLLSTVTGGPYLYLWTDVPTGTYTLTARATSTAGLVSTSEPVTVRVLAAPTITMVRLSNGAVINDDTLTVTGTVQAPANSSISVNGVIGSIAPDGSFFVNDVPLAPGMNVLTVIVTTPEGQTTTQTITVRRRGQSPFVFSASPTEGLAPLRVNFTLVSRGRNVTYARADLSCRDNGTIDQTTPAPDTAVGTCLYNAPGIYTARVKVVDGQEQTVYTGTVSINVMSLNVQDSLLRGVYYSMLARLKARDISGALNYITAGVHDKYIAVFSALDAVSSTNLSTAVSQLGTIQDGEIGTDYAEYVIVRNLPDGSQQAFLIYLIRGEDGIWRIDGM